jgi:hypothetical protein
MQTEKGRSKDRPFSFVPTKTALASHQRRFYLFSKHNSARRILWREQERPAQRALAREQARRPHDAKAQRLGK